MCKLVSASLPFEGDTHDRPFSIKDLLQLFCVERRHPNQMCPFDWEGVCVQTQRAEPNKAYDFLLCMAAIAC